MKKIFVAISLVAIVSTIQSCKVLCPKLCKDCYTQKAEIFSNLTVTDSVVAVTDSITPGNSLNIFVKEEILPFYIGDFDTLVKKTSLEQLQRDMGILQAATFNDSVSIKIIELKEYHSAKSLLSKKFETIVIDSTIKLLKNKRFPSHETDRLISLLENYGFIRQDLVALIQEINQKKETPDVPNYVIYAKINERVFKFLYPDDNNNANMSNYPLVLDICNRILKSKREDLNADILYLINEI